MRRPALEQLGLDIAVVDIERSRPRHCRAEHSLEILVSVVEIQGHVILAGLPTRELVALSMQGDPLVDEALASRVDRSADLGK